MRRPLTFVAALSVALLVYLVFVVLIVGRLSRLVHVTGVRAQPAAKPLVQGGRVNVFGYYVPWPVVAMAGSVAPTWWVTAGAFRVARRRRREQLGQCLDCGYQLTSKRGRCPRCGLRYELSVIIHAPRFPVPARVSQ